VNSVSRSLSLVYSYMTRHNTSEISYLNLKFYSLVLPHFINYAISITKLYDTPFIVIFPVIFLKKVSLCEFGNTNITCSLPFVNCAVTFSVFVIHGYEPAYRSLQKVAASERTSRRGSSPSTPVSVHNSELSLH
jgi:hypothetical protein